MKVVFKLDGTIQVINLGYTSNKKIAEQRYWTVKSGKNIGKVQSISIVKIVQTYTFSIEQFDYIKESIENDTKIDFREFFALDAKNCFDCPFSINSGNGGCYTHKYMQYSGFIKMIKSLIKKFGASENIPNYNKSMHFENAIKIAKNRFVRFGSYGEPTLHPIELVESLSNVAKNWTGYTHQWFKKPEYAKYFMASVHNNVQEKSAKVKFKFRSFVATKTGINEFIQCPASKEAGFKSNCSKCGLCSGTNGKGSKSVVILVH
jgi:hypothetical protein